MDKVTFNPMGGDFCIPGSGVVTKTWQIKRDGVVVGHIESRINDLFQSLTNPGYSVNVFATIDGVEKQFRRNSNAFSNRSMREARENRSYYVAQAKEWARKASAYQPLSSGSPGLNESPQDKSGAPPSRAGAKLGAMQVGHLGGSAIEQGESQ